MGLFAFCSTRKLMWEEELDAILVVASKRIVYHSISENLTPIKTTFQELRRKYRVESDLSWLAIERIDDETTRVNKLFQDAWNKDLLEILGETLFIRLKRIHSMFGNLLPFSPIVSATASQLQTFSQPQPLNQGPIQAISFNPQPSLPSDILVDTPSITLDITKLIGAQNPPRAGLLENDRKLWKFSCLLVPTELEIEQQQRRFNKLFAILSGEVEAALKRFQTNGTIPSEIPFKVKSFIAGSFANRTAIGGQYVKNVQSDMDVIMILNDGSSCKKRVFEHGRDLEINNTPIVYGTREDIRNALLEAIEQTKLYNEFTKCVFRDMNSERHRYSFKDGNWECDILPALATGGNIYYFLNCSDTHQLSDNQNASVEFKALADSRKGLRDIIRCLKLAKREWKLEDPKIPSCLFEVAIFSVASNMSSTDWDGKSFAIIWKSAWEYILDKVLKSEEIPAPNNPSSDLIRKLKAPQFRAQFIEFCNYMILQSANEENLLKLLIKQLNSLGQ